MYFLVLIVIACLIHLSIIKAELVSHSMFFKFKFEIISLFLVPSMVSDSE